MTAPHVNKMDMNKKGVANKKGAGNKKGDARKMWVVIASIFSLLLCSACTVPEGFGLDEAFRGKESGEASQKPLKILISKESAPLTLALQIAGDELGFDVEIERCSSTPQCTNRLSEGFYDGKIDATLFATNRYVDLAGASEKLSSATSVALSPVAIGVWDETAKQNGWDSVTPTWSDVAGAAANESFTYALDFESLSFARDAARVAVASSLSGTGMALTQDDISTVLPRLGKFVDRESPALGGWIATPDRLADGDFHVDGVIGTEAEILNTIDQGIPLRLVIPADGSIMADYPLSALAKPARKSSKSQVEALAQYLLDHRELLAKKNLRPVRGQGSDGQEPVFEIPFPQDLRILNRLRIPSSFQQFPAHEMFIAVDTSSSMEGQPLERTKEILAELSKGMFESSYGEYAFRPGDKISFFGLTPQSSGPSYVAYDPEDPDSYRELEDFANGLNTGPKISTCETLIRGLLGADGMGNAVPAVIFTTGTDEDDPECENFESNVDSLPEESGPHPAYIFLLDPAHTEWMDTLAEITGGQVFDATTDEGVREGMREVRE